MHNDGDDDFTQHTRFDFPPLGPELEPFDRQLFVVGTCNGLLCLYNELSQYKIDFYFLWNPCVRRFVRLPSPNVTFRTNRDCKVSIGFGVDAKTNDYKVVRLVNVLNNPNIPKDRPVVEVYSLATGEWRRVAALPPICTPVRDSKPQRFVNKALHWLAFRRSDDPKTHSFILVFDLEDEAFREILLPEVPNSPSASVSVYGNSIAFSQRMSDNLNIWVMKEYGVAFSRWTKVCTVSDHGLGEVIPYPVGFRRNGEVVLIDQGQLVSMDLENQKKKDLLTNSRRSYFVDSYVESQVLLDKAANVAVTY